MGPISAFMEKHFRHYNARETLDAARAYKQFIESGNKMMVTLAGAMSSGELGVILARMIRAGKVHAISCTAANLEEDVFNLVARREYEYLPNYHCLTPQQELEIRDRGFNRVTDTAIPETVIRHMEDALLVRWKAAAQKGERYTPYEYLRQLFRDRVLEPYYQVPPEESWLLAAHEMDIPVFSPGFEDSTTGNIFAAHVIMKELPHHLMVKTGTEQMEMLVNWYLENEKHGQIGFFQIGGGIAGDFAICAVPLIIQDMERKETKLWGYFAQITDADVSYGGYSGAVPNEKITWFKLDVNTPKFNIHSDATLVAPLIFAYVLGE